MRARPARAVWFLLCLEAATLAAGADRDLRLIEAVRHGDTAGVRSLLKAHVDVNARAGDGATALYWAAYRDDRAIADLLIRGGATVDVTNDLGVTPLWIASRNASTAMIAKLLNARANPNLAPPVNGTPLMIAARRGNTEGAKMLLAHGADVNAREAARGQTALMWAASENHVDTMQLLIEAGADIQARSQTVRRHVLMCCQVYEGDKGSEADVDEGGFTPIIFAAQQGNIDSARLLLKAGANVNDATPLGTSPLVVAIHGDHPALAAFLLDNGADPNDGRAGYTALHLATVRGDLGLAGGLLAHGANVNARQTKGSQTNRVRSNHAMNKSMVGATPFLLATRVAELDMMRLLAKSGANVKATLDDGTTPIMAATAPTSIQALRLAEDRIVEAIALAIELGAAANGANRDGDTALHIAATRRLDGVVRLLAEHGADLNARNHNQETPLALAIKAPPVPHGVGLYIITAYDALVKHTGTAELLRQLGAKE